VSNGLAGGSSTPVSRRSSSRAPVTLASVHGLLATTQLAPDQLLAYVSRLARLLPLSQNLPPFGPPSGTPFGTPASASASASSHHPISSPRSPAATTPGRVSLSQRAEAAVGAEPPATARVLAHVESVTTALAHTRRQWQRFTALFDELFPAAALAGAGLAWRAQVREFTWLLFLYMRNAQPRAFAADAAECYALLLCCITFCYQCNTAGVLGSDPALDAVVLAAIEPADGGFVARQLLATLVARYAFRGREGGGLWGLFVCCNWRVGVS
jgi:hypothetical protein